MRIGGVECKLLRTQPHGARVVTVGSDSIHSNRRAVGVGLIGNMDGNAKRKRYNRWFSLLNDFTSRTVNLGRDLAQSVARLRYNYSRLYRCYMRVQIPLWALV